MKHFLYAAESAECLSAPVKTYIGLSLKKTTIYAPYEARNLLLHKRLRRDRNGAPNSPSSSPSPKP